MDDTRRTGPGTLLVAALVVLSSWPAWAQAPAAYRPPRMASGEPNLQGIWQVLNTAAWDIQDHGARLGVPAGVGVVDGGEIPYQPWALAQKQKNFETRATSDPETKCWAPGVPRLTYMPFPFQIVQASRYVAIVYEYNHHQRFIYMDGKHPVDIPSWLGDSRGRWEGDTLVVDVVHFNDQTRLDRAGNFHSEMLHVVERYSLADCLHLNYDVTIEDPKVFTRPWHMRMPLYRRIEPFPRVLEYYCYAFHDVFTLPDGR